MPITVRSRLSIEPVLAEQLSDDVAGRRADLRGAGTQLAGVARRPTTRPAGDDRNSSGAGRDAWRGDASPRAVLVEDLHGGVSQPCVTRENLRKHRQTVANGSERMKEDAKVGTEAGSLWSPFRKCPQNRAFCAKPNHTSNFRPSVSSYPRRASR